MNCVLCKASMTRGEVNHIVDLGKIIVIVKGVPANVCKQCGEYYLDNETALKLEGIVNEIRKIKVEVSIVNYNEAVA